MEFEQFNVLHSLVVNVAYYALVLHGQTEMHPDCVLFSCCSPTSSASAIYCWLYPLQLAAPWLCLLQLLLLGCICLLSRTCST